MVTRGVLGRRVLGHDLTLTWPDLKSNFEIDLSRSNHMFQTGSTSQIRWCQFYFHVSDIKKVINGEQFVWKTIIFHLMTSGTKTVDLRSNLIENAIGAWKEISNVFFLFFLAIILWELIAIVCKNLTVGDLNIDMAWKWPCRSLRSRKGLSNAVCCLLLCTVLLEIPWGFLNPTSTTNWTF